MEHTHMYNSERRKHSSCCCSSPHTQFLETCLHFSERRLTAVRTARAASVGEPVGNGPSPVDTTLARGDCGRPISVCLHQAPSPAVRSTDCRPLCCAAPDIEAARGRAAVGDRLQSHHAGFVNGDGSYKAPPRDGY